MVTVKKVNKQNLCDDLMVENLKQARRIAALDAEVASLRINQQRHAKIAAQMEDQLVEVNSGRCVYKNWPVYVAEWARQLRQ